MGRQTTRISSDPRRRVQRVVRWIWSAVVVMAGVILGALAARSHDASQILLSRLSAAGAQYGYIMPQLRLDQPTFRQAISTLAEQSHVKIDVDWAALNEAGAKCDTPLQFDWRLRNISLDQVLPRILNSVPKARINVSNDIIYVPLLAGIRITTHDAGCRQNGSPPSVVRIYDVRALLQKIHAQRADVGQDTDDSNDEFIAGSGVTDERCLEDDIEYNVAQYSWLKMRGSIGDIHFAGGRMIVVQQVDIQDEVKKKLDKLSEPDPPDPAPSKDAYSEAELDQIVPDLRLGHVTLRAAVDALRLKTGANIFVNWKRLSEVGVMPDTGVEFSPQNATMEQALTTLTANVDPKGTSVGWRIRGGMITISSIANFGFEPVMMRSYPVGDILDRLATGRGAESAASDPARSLVDLVRRNVSPDEWHQNGKSEVDFRRHCVASVWAGRLIVTQTRLNQRKIARYLKTLREER